MLSPVTSACCSPLSFIAPSGGISGASASITLSSLVAGSAFTSSASHLLLPIASSSPLSAISGCLLSSIAGDSRLSAVLGCFSSLIASNGPLFTISDHLLSFVSGDGLLFAVSSGGSLSSIPLASSWVLFLPSTPSYIHCLFLPFLPLFHFFALFPYTACPQVNSIY